MSTTPQWYWSSKWNMYYCIKRENGHDCYVLQDGRRIPQTDQSVPRSGKVPNGPYQSNQSSQRYGYLSPEPQQPFPNSPPYQPQGVNPGYQQQSSPQQQLPPQQPHPDHFVSPLEATTFDEAAGQHRNVQQGSNPTTSVTSIIATGSQGEKVLLPTPGDHELLDPISIGTSFYHIHQLDLPPLPSHMIAFKRRTDPRKFFRQGRVFLTLCKEPAGDSNATQVTRVPYGQGVYTRIRRFIVIREGLDFCLAVPIITYGGRGLSKPGVVREEHVVVYTGRQQPRYEEGTIPIPIRIIPDQIISSLDPTSTANLGKVYTIDRNLKVRPFGMVMDVGALMEAIARVEGKSTRPSRARQRVDDIQKERDNDTDSDSESEHDDEGFTEANSPAKSRAGPKGIASDGAVAVIDEAASSLKTEPDNGLIGAPNLDFAEANHVQSSQQVETPPFRSRFPEADLAGFDSPAEGCAQKIEPDSALSAPDTAASAEMSVAREVPSNSPSDQTGLASGTGDEIMNGPYTPPDPAKDYINPNGEPDGTAPGQVSIKHNDSGRFMDNPSQTVASDSDSDYAGSICSLGSERSSVTSVGDVILSHKTIHRFVEALFYTEELSTVYVSAIQDEAIGVNKFRRNLRRMISGYGRNLKAEAGSGADRTAARMLQTRNISERVVSRILERSCPAAVPGEADSTDPVEDKEWHWASDASSDSFDEPEPRTDFGESDFRAIEAFLKSSKAYGHFKTQLLEFVHLPYEKRLLHSIESACDTEGGLDRDQWKALGKELSWVPTNLFCFQENESLGLFNGLKAWVEDHMGETWDWWPLQPRQYPVKAGWIRVKWLSPCGNARSVDLPQQTTLALQRVTDSAPDLVNNAQPVKAVRHGIWAFTRISSRPCEHGNITNTSSSSSSPNKSPTQPNAPSRHQTQGQQPSLPLQQGGHHPPPPPPPPSIGPVQTYNISSQTFKPRHVYLCIKTGYKYHFSDLKVHELRTDAKVFSSLKKEYHEARRGLRHRFSIWQYDHCEFSKFLNTPRLTAPLDEGFPPDSDSLYDFQPRPIRPKPPAGPIPKEEFRDSFYSYCDKCCHRWHWQQMRRWVPGLYDNSAVEVLPKRTLSLVLNNGNREEFWGLLVREVRAFRIISVYILLFNSPGIIFFFLWLFYWGHSSDLQNASVPFLFSLSLTIGFVGLLFQSGEGDLR